MLSTIWFEHNSDFLQWQERTNAKIFNVNMSVLAPDETAQQRTMIPRPRFFICVVYYVEE